MKAQDRARNILDQHNFYWFMADNYDKAEREAKSNMRHFLDIISTLDKQTQEELKNEWISRYNEARA